jgi:oxygen-independent coproporphyrinogen-3 oxidase
VAASEAPVAESRERPEDERLGDALFTGLRLTAGLDFDEIGARYGVDAWGRYEEALKPQASAGRLIIEGHRVRLTRDGMLVANDVMTVFV